LKNLVQQQNQGGEFLKPLTWKNIQENYCWNHFLSLELNDIGLGEFCAPIICGFVSQQIVSIKNEIYKIILISRRHKNRAGYQLLLLLLFITSFIPNSFFFILYNIN